MCIYGDCDLSTSANDLETQNIIRPCKHYWISVKGIKYLKKNNRRSQEAAEQYERTFGGS